ncbi:MAG: M20/M25/M40 family metallo-hydrolase [Chloroflexi bacterium]|nr:M20/M25/M40 family metallo-hydrolase [Chloroflexota bacterium]MBU1751216.1 M20/M25/M40 family metallo-hydrolase [Chloroflexota bacterium]
MINQDRLLNTFLDLVKIDSPFGEEGEVARYAAGRLRGLGFEVHTDKMHNVYGYLPGVGEPILLNAHLDGVDPCRGIKPQVSADGVIRSDGNTILGADDRSGVAAILEAAHVVTGEKLDHLPIEIVFTVREERGLHGAKSLDYARIRAKQALAVDGGGPNNIFVIAAPSQNGIQAAIFGKAAHAGAAPEAGINAIRVVSEAIAQMPLGRLDDETTSNIGVIRGGTASNIVPDRVEITGEVRSHSERKLQQYTKQIIDEIEHAAAAAKAQTDIQVTRSYPAFRLRKSSTLVKRVAAATKALGEEAEFVVAGGGSDANIFNAHGIQTLIVSTGMMNVHTTEEYVSVADMMRCADILISVLTNGL